MFVAKDANNHSSPLHPTKFAPPTHPPSSVEVCFRSFQNQCPLDLCIQQSLLLAACAAKTHDKVTSSHLHPTKFATYWWLVAKIYETVAAHLCIQQSLLPVASHRPAGSQSRRLCRPLWDTKTRWSCDSYARLRYKCSPTAMWKKNVFFRIEINLSTQFILLLSCSRSFIKQCIFRT